MIIDAHAHLVPTALLADASNLAIGAVLGVLVLLEANAIVGRQGPIAPLAGALGCGIVLTLVLYGMMVFL